MLQLRSNIHTNKKIVAAPLSFHPKRGRLPSNPRAREILFLHRVLPPEEQMPARRLWWGPPRRKSQTVTQRWPPTGRSCREGPLRKGSPEISQSFLLSTGQRFRSASRNFLRSVLRSGKILMQNCATLRNAMRKRNYELPSVSNDTQSSETLRNSSGLNYKSAALPAELCRPKCGAH